MNNNLLNAYFFAFILDENSNFFESSHVKIETTWKKPFVLHLEKDVDPFRNRGASQIEMIFDNYKVFGKEAFINDLKKMLMSNGGNEVVLKTIEVDIRIFSNSNIQTPFFHFPYKFSVNNESVTLDLYAVIRVTFHFSGGKESFYSEADVDMATSVMRNVFAQKMMSLFMEEEENAEAMRLLLLSTAKRFAIDDASPIDIKRLPMELRDAVLRKFKYSGIYLMDFIGVNESTFKVSNSNIYIKILYTFINVLTAQSEEFSTDVVWDKKTNRVLVSIEPRLDNLMENARIVFNGAYFGNPDGFKQRLFNVVENFSTERYLVHKTNNDNIVSEITQQVYDIWQPFFVGEE